MNCGLNIKGEIPKLIKTETNDMGKRYIFSLPAGLCLSDFERLKEELETALKEPFKCDLTHNYNIAIQIYHLRYEKEYKPVNVPLQANKLIYPIGISLTTSGARVVNIEFNRSSSHMLICGGTGKGKSVFVLNLIAQSMLKKHLDVYISDLKATGSYNVFKNCKNLKLLVKEESDTINLLTEILKEMKDRYKILDKHNCSDQQEYNKKCNGKMKSIVLLVEEFVNLSHNSKAIELLNILLAQASGAGIHIFLTVQRPDAKTLDTRFKSNLSYTVAFKAKNSSNSEVYLDKGDFRAYKDLHGKGEALLLKDDEDIFFKSYYLTNEEIESMVKHTYIDKPELEIEGKQSNKIIPLKKKEQPKDPQPKKEKEVDLL